MFQRPSSIVTVIECYHIYESNEFLWMQTIEQMEATDHVIRTLVRFGHTQTRMHKHMYTHTYTHTHIYTHTQEAKGLHNYSEFSSCSRSNKWNKKAANPSLIKRVWGGRLPAFIGTEIAFLVFHQEHYTTRVISLRWKIIRER